MIEYDPLGTVTVTIDDDTYKLGRPKFKQYRYFTRRLVEISAETQEKLNALAGAARAANEVYEADPSDENLALMDKATTELEEFSKTPFYETSSNLLVEMFKQLGDPLPKNKDDWPAALVTDVSIPGQIIRHWQRAPKASGANGME